MGKSATVWDDATLERLRFEADPPVDGLIARHAEHQAATRGGVAVNPRILPGQLGKHLVLPPEHRSPALDEYLADTPPWPAWADPGLVKRGEEFFAFRGLEIGSSLFCASLPEAYAGARGARVLTLTSRMVSDPVRRVNETAQMVFHALQPDGLVVGDGPGYQDIRRVRLMHAAVRYLILHDDQIAKTDDPTAGEHSWSPAGGLPINQEDLLGTLMTFTCVVFTSLERLGLPPTTEEAEAYLHTWCVIGHLLGIRPDLLPIELDAAWSLAAAIRRRQHRASRDGELLGTALSDAMARSMPLAPLRGLPSSTIRWLVGDEVATMVGIKKSDWTRVLFGPLRRAMSALPVADGDSRLVRRLTSHVTASVLRGFLDANRGGTRPPFDLPRRIQDRLKEKPVSWRL
jgi:hypothetical protein